jgi:hypothetical protein
MVCELLCHVTVSSKLYVGDVRQLGPLDVYQFVRFVSDVVIA